MITTDTDAAQVRPGQIITCGQADIYEAEVAEVANMPGGIFRIETTAGQAVNCPRTFKVTVHEMEPLEVTHRGFNGTRTVEFVNRWEVRDSRWDGIGRRDAPDAHLRTHDTHEAALADYEARRATGLRPTLEQVRR